MNVLILQLLCSMALAGKQAVIPDKIDDYVIRVMHQFKVPGLSLAIVKDGRAVLVRGYGVRTLGQSAVVDEKTLFGIASNTKAFTATALALLVEDNKIKWDSPVIDYLPGFQMYDPYVTREMTVRDLLVHRSGLGLGAGDLLWWPPSDLDRKEITRRLRFIKPATSFRTAYAYDNVLYTVAGELIQAVSGRTWEEFITERILQRIGMDGTEVLHSASLKGGNIATPHAEVDGTVRPVAAFTADNVNPAGGIHSSAEDMAKWMIVQLDSGRLGDTGRLFSASSARQLWSLVTPIPIGNINSDFSDLQPNFRGYALGFSLRDYLGKKIVSHTGGLPGYVSRVTLVPEIKTGITVLTNQEAGEGFEVITNYLLDFYLRGKTVDRLAAYIRDKARTDSLLKVEAQKTESKRNTDSRPSLPLKNYAGLYTDAWYGDVRIDCVNDALVMTFTHTPSLLGDLQHWQYDTFVVRWRDRELRADAFITFALTPDGRIDQAKMEAVSSATDFSFDFHDLLLKPKKQ